MWICTGNKLAKFHGNTLSLSKNIAKCFRGATFFDSHCTLWHKNCQELLQPFCGNHDTVTERSSVCAVAVHYGYVFIVHRCRARHMANILIVFLDSAVLQFKIVLYFALF